MGTIGTIKDLHDLEINDFLPCSESLVIGWARNDEWYLPLQETAQLHSVLHFFGTEGYPYANGLNILIETSKFRLCMDIQTESEEVYYEVYDTSLYEWNKHTLWSGGTIGGDFKDGTYGEICGRSEEALCVDRKFFVLDTTEWTPTERKITNKEYVDMGSDPDQDFEHDVLDDFGFYLSSNVKAFVEGDTLPNTETLRISWDAETAEDLYNLINDNDPIEIKGYFSDPDWTPMDVFQAEPTYAQNSAAMNFYLNVLGSNPDWFIFFGETEGQFEWSFYPDDFQEIIAEGSAIVENTEAYDALGLEGLEIVSVPSNLETGIYYEDTTLSDVIVELDPPNISVNTINEDSFLFNYDFNNDYDTQYLPRIEITPVIGLDYDQEDSVFIDLDESPYEETGTYLFDELEDFNVASSGQPKIIKLYFRSRQAHPATWETVVSPWTAEFEIKQYTVTFDSQGGTAVDPIILFPTLDVEEPEEPTKAGFTFMGWFDNVTMSPSSLVSFPYEMPDGDVTLYAKWVSDFEPGVKNAINEIKYTGSLVKDNDREVSNEDDIVDFGGSDYCVYNWDNVDVEFIERLYIPTLYIWGYSDTPEPPNSFTRQEFTNIEDYQDYDIFIKQREGQPKGNISLYVLKSIVDAFDPEDTFQFWYHQYDDNDGWFVTNLIPVVETLSYRIDFSGTEWDWTNEIGITNKTGASANHSRIMWVSENKYVQGFSYLASTIDGASIEDIEDVQLQIEGVDVEYAQLWLKRNASATTYDTGNYSSWLEQALEETMNAGTDMFHEYVTQSECYAVGSDYYPASLNEPTLTIESTSQTKIELDYDYNNEEAMSLFPNHIIRIGIWTGGLRVTKDDIRFYHTEPEKTTGIHEFDKFVYGETGTIRERTLTYDTMGGSSIPPDTPFFEDIDFQLRAQAGTWLNWFYYSNWSTIQTATINPDPIELPWPPTKTGHTFVGWYFEDTYENPIPVQEPPLIPTFEMPDEDITLYAKWEINEITYTFDSMGGTAVASITQDWNTSADEPTPPTKEEHFFVGWYTTPSYVSLQTWPSTMLHDTTLYAKWAPTNRIFVNGGTFTSIPEGWEYEEETDSYKTTEAVDQYLLWRDFLAGDFGDLEKDGYVLVAYATDASLLRNLKENERPVDYQNIYARWFTEKEIKEGINIFLHDSTFNGTEFETEIKNITKQTMIGVSVIERLPEELDSGRVTIAYSERNFEYDMLTPLEIIIADKEKNILERHDMLIMRDNMHPISKDITPMLYRHELEIIELTHMLDQHIINTLSYTQPLISVHRAPFEHRYMAYGWNNEEQEWQEDPHPVLATWYDYIIIKLPTIDIKNVYEGTIEIPQHKGTVLFAPDITGWEPEDDTDFIDLSEYTPTEPTDPDFAQGLDFKVKLKVYTKPRPNALFSEATEYDGVEYIISHEQYESNPLVLDLPSGDYIIEYGMNLYTPYRQWLSEARRIERFIRYHVRVNRKMTKTLLDVVKNIRNCVPLEKQSTHDFTRLFDIPDTLASILDKIVAPQMLLTQITVRQGLNGILKYINAISRLMTDQFGHRELSARFFNERNEPFEIDDIFTYNSEKDTLNYSTKGRAFLNNVINSNNIENPSVSDPAMIGYRGLRTEEMQFLPDNPKLILNYPIFRICKVTAWVALGKRYGQGSGLGDGAPSDGKWTMGRGMEVDLTSRVVEESEWELKNATNDVFGSTALNRINSTYDDKLRGYRIECAKYKYMGKTIDFSGTVGEFFPRQNLQTILTASISEQLLFELGTSNVDDDVVLRDTGGTTWPDKIRHFIGGDNYSDYGTLQPSPERRAEDFMVRVEYIAFDDNVHDAERDDIDTIYKDTTKKINQGDKLINYERASVNNYGVAQRYGVPTINFSKITKDITTLPKLADFTPQNQVVVEKETLCYRDYYLGKFEVSKDFNRLSKFVGIDREFRPYENPRPERSYKRNDMFTDYLEFEAVDSVPETIENDTYITPLFLESFLNTLKRTTDKDDGHITTALAITDGFLTQHAHEKETDKDEVGLIVPVVAIGGKNTLSFKFGWDSNQLAGDKLTVNPEGILTEGEMAPGTFREAVRYTDGRAEFEWLYFRFINELEQTTESIPWAQQGKIYPRLFEQTKKYPLYSYDRSTVDAYTYGKTGDETDKDPIMVYKDASSKYELTYQVSLVPKNTQARNDVVLGRKFCVDNFLVKPATNDNLTIYFYKNGETHHAFDDEFVFDSFDGSEVASLDFIEVNGDIVGIEMNTDEEGYTGWAIGDDNQELYLASNTNKTKILFSPKHHRTGVQYNNMTTYVTPTPPTPPDDITQVGDTLIINAVYSTTVEQDNDTIKIV